jgi:hypothetical protein
MSGKTEEELVILSKSDAAITTKMKTQFGRGDVRNGSWNIWCLMR